MLIGNLSPIEMLTANPNEVYIQTMEILEKTKSHPLLFLAPGVIFLRMFLLKILMRLSKQEKIGDKNPFLKKWKPIRVLF